jgi:hypothetical protein
MQVARRNRVSTPLNPLDLVEEIITANEWTFERTSAEELIVEVAGRWCDYNIFFAWCRETNALQFCAACELRIPSARRAAVRDLVLLINDKLWLGHFGISGDDYMLTFRHTVLLRGTPGATTEQVEDMLDIALSECDRYYPAYQFVMWGARTPIDALAAALIDPVAEA